MSIIQKLPNEIWLHILSFTPLYDRQANLSRVCKLFNSFVNDNCFDTERTIARIYLQYPRNIINAVGGIQKFLALDTSETFTHSSKPTRGTKELFLAFTTISHSNGFLIKKNMSLLRYNLEDWYVYSKREHIVEKVPINEKFCDFMRRLFADEPCGIFMVFNSKETPRILPNGKTVTYLVKGCS
jgi:hypothetical protein